MSNKYLEVEGCKVFVCPNLNLIDEKGKELGLSEEAIKESKSLAIEYLKKTYHHPKYSSIKKVLPAFVYIVGIQKQQGQRESWNAPQVLNPMSGYRNSDLRSLYNIAKVFGCGKVNISKWAREIAKELNIISIIEFYESLSKRNRGN